MTPIASLVVEDIAALPAAVSKLDHSKPVLRPGEPVRRHAYRSGERTLCQIDPVTWTSGIVVEAGQARLPALPRRAE